MLSTNPALQPTAVIPLLGATGSGKSSLTNAIIGTEAAPVGHDLESLTAEVSHYSTTSHGKTIRVVDTPGFNDFRSEGSKTDLEILTEISNLMKEEYDAGVKFSGVIFVHNISAPKIDRMARRNMVLFRKICGKESMKNVVVVTTFWDLVDFEQGESNERELQQEEGLLKELHDAGAKFFRMGHFEDGAQPDSDGFATPQQIVDHLLSLNPVWLQIQKEMETKSVPETSVGSTLMNDFEELKADYRRNIETLQSEIATLRSANEDERNHREVLREEAKSLREALRVWEEHGSEMKAKMARLETQQKQVAMKEELEAWQSAHLTELEGLRLHVSQCKHNSQDFDLQRSLLEGRNPELSAALEKAQAERDAFLRQCQELLASNAKLLDQLRDTVSHRALERSQSDDSEEIARLREEVHKLRAAALQPETKEDPYYLLSQREPGSISPKTATSPKSNLKPASLRWNTNAILHPQPVTVGPVMLSRVQSPPLVTASEPKSDGDKPTPTPEPLKEELERIRRAAVVTSQTKKTQLNTGEEAGSITSPPERKSARRATK
ncbi:hypothetical protein CC1G_12343 [Coprinopsis cinerea okayama7|uniref:AIG1-type G domain-containing protein n=1 Tax=Coprinopsis cinerea (strain Okayama-7 / 130 / ATCC MYA-4618 / FGSC 9003) TaxID=240176 RepID=A8NJN2_COPC7|nr:hypothetical protein CC1G_12343 [Coprinopsis cinerea okayama7\|eukprot:XP_001834264.1 hypothetical protein CC1G_12343 [Coprinopsis cinerea okayama7\